MNPAPQLTLKAVILSIILTVILASANAYVGLFVGLGGLLGVLFSVPLRRTLIIEQKLRFPEGVAAAEVLKVGANPGVGAKYLGLAAFAIWRAQVRYIGVGSELPGAKWWAAMVLLGICYWIFRAGTPRRTA